MILRLKNRWSSSTQNFELKSKRKYSLSVLINFSHYGSFFVALKLNNRNYLARSKLHNFNVLADSYLPRIKNDWSVLGSYAVFVLILTGIERLWYSHGSGGGPQKKLNDLWKLDKQEASYW